MPLAGSAELVCRLPTTMHFDEHRITTTIKKRNTLQNFPNMRCRGVAVHRNLEVHEDVPFVNPYEEMIQHQYVADMGATVATDLVHIPYLVANVQRLLLSPL